MILLAVLLINATTWGQWGAEMNLTEGSVGGSWTTTNNARSLACRGDTVFLVWHDFRVSPRNYGCEIYFKYFNGSAWTPDSVIGTFSTARYYFNWNPSSAVDSLGRLHVVWESNGINAPNSSDYDIVYRRREAGGWTTPIKLSSHPLYSWYPSLVCGPGGRIYVFWQDNRQGPFKIFYRQYDGSSWLAETCLDTFCLSAGYPSAAISLGFPAVAWQDFREGISQIFFCRMGPSGWEADSAVSHSSAGAYGPALASDEAGNLHLAWEDFQDGNSEIYYRRFSISSNSWGPITRATYDPSHSRQPSLVCRGDSLVDIFWADDREGNYEIYRLTIKNGLWSQEQRLTSQAAFSLNPSVVADSQGNLHLAWADQRGHPGYSPDIYYKKYTVEPTGVFPQSTIGPPFSDLNIYPNPSSGPLHVALAVRHTAAKGFLDFQVYNIAGQLIWKQVLDISASGRPIFNWLGRDHNLGPGVYLAVISDGNYRLSQKFVIVK